MIPRLRMRELCYSLDPGLRYLARIKPCNKCNFRESDISAEEQRALAIDHSHDEKDERAAC